MTADVQAGPRRRRRRGAGGDGAPVVPDATFTSYYGRPVVKASPWESDIPAYLFLGGFAAGSSLLGAGADLTSRAVLRRAGRLAGAGGITLSFLALVHDLGKPARFLNMLRVAKPTSPMSMGTWLLVGYGPLAGLAAAAELRSVLPLPGALRRLLASLARPAGLGAALVAPAIASYTGVLLADTATPAWRDAHRELPFVFVASAATAAGGFGMLAAPLHESAPARRLAVLGVLGEALAEARMRRSMGLSAETLEQGLPGRLHRTSRALTLAGGLAAVVLGRRSRVGAAVTGAALLAGSACLRFAVFEAGQASARDPKYTMVPQRARANAQRGTSSGQDDTGGRHGGILEG